MTDHAHLFRVCQDSMGNLQAGAGVRIYVHGTTTLSGVAFYTDDLLTIPGSNVFTLGSDGRISLYVASPLRVDVGITPPSGVETIFDGQDFLIPVSGGGGNGFRTGTGLDSVIGGDLYPIDHGASTATDVDALVIGGGANAGYRSTVMGVYSEAPAGNGAAFGWGASAKGILQVAIGQQSRAWGSRSVGVGQACQAGEENANFQVLAEYCVAIGQATNARGSYSTAVGAQANTGVRLETVAIGAGSGAGADNATALGAFAGAYGLRSIAVGHGANSFNADEGIWQNNSLEIVRSSPTGTQTALILRDTAGVRWEITVDTTGHLTTQSL